MGDEYETGKVIEISAHRENINPCMDCGRCREENN